MNQYLHEWIEDIWEPGVSMSINYGFELTETTTCFNFHGDTIHPSVIICHNVPEDLRSNYMMPLILIILI